MDKYGYALKYIGRVPDVLAGTMGNLMYIANFKTKEELDNFYSDISLLK